MARRASFDDPFASGGVSAHHLDWLADSDDEDVAEFNTGESIITIENVHKTYLLGLEGVPALRGVSASVRRGEFVIIFGTSGGGKTSLLNIMGTIDKPTKGEVRVCGTRVNSSTSDKQMANIRLNRIGFVFQTFNLLGSLTALENVMLPMILKGVLSKKERRTRALNLLNSVGMGDRIGHFPSMLSGGEQQRVTIARAIANSPDLLLLDEPTGDLDKKNSDNVMDLLLRLNREEKITLVMVTHDVGLKQLADRILWIRDGKINRVEITDPQVHQNALDELAANMAAMHADATLPGPAPAPDEPPAPTYENTSVRMPSFYGPTRRVTSRRGRRTLARIMRKAGVNDPGLFPEASDSAIPKKEGAATTSTPSSEAAPMSVAVAMPPTSADSDSYYSATAPSSDGGGVGGARYAEEQQEHLVDLASARLDALDADGVAVLGAEMMAGLASHTSSSF